MRLLILILLISCTKVSDRGIRRIIEQGPELERLETNEYSEKIDVMVAFLWPAQVTSEAQRASIRDIIAGSRKLKNLQDSYFEKKLVLGRAWEMEECDCVLNGICDDTPPESDSGKCTELEERVYANERALTGIYEIVEKMKADVAQSGGEWLKTHSDFTELPVSEMNFRDSLLTLSVFAPEAEPTPYTGIAFEIRNNGRYDSLKARFNDSHDRGEWLFDMTIQRTPEALKFQGKLLLEKGNVRREGIVYWMNPVVI